MHTEVSRTKRTIQSTSHSNREVFHREVKISTVLVKDKL